MQKNDNIKNFIEWIQAYKHHHLKNEDDVETKFVIPFFEQLGYPENCRRGKYPVNVYKPGKKGRKPEIDQIYFSTNESNKQTEDTCLVIVEAKEPKEINLKKALEQAKFYVSSLKPLTLIATNGYQLKALKYRPYHSDEIIFDSNIEILKQTEEAERFYKEFNFEILKDLKERGTDFLSHTQYVKLEESLKKYPDLQNILDQGDFTPSITRTKFKTSITRTKDRLTVVKPKVAIEAELPLAFGYCKCKIEFSHIIRRGLTIKLSHQDIFANLMQGIGTLPHWNTRRFIRKIDENSYETTLGQITTILSEEEAIDLCDCIDEVCGEFKNIILQAEKLLETKDFIVFYDGEENFMNADIRYYLFSVKPEFWELMLRFTREFDYGKGDSEWHIFDGRHNLIWVSGPKENRLLAHTFIFSRETGEKQSDKYIDLIYGIPSWFLEDFDSLEDNIGTKGIWTATYTRDWLLNKFIPRVIQYAQESQSLFSNKKQSMIILKKKGIFRHIPDWMIEKFFKYQVCQILDCEIYHNYNKHSRNENKKIPIPQIEHPEQLRDYIEDIQNWLYHRKGNIAANLLYPFLSAFVNLIKGIDPLSVNIGYISSNIYSIRNKPPETINGYSDITTYLEYFFTWAKNNNFIDMWHADLIFRICCAISDGKFISFDQFQLNAVKQAIQPLLELKEFETRYVFSHWRWNGLHYE